MKAVLCPVCFNGSGRLSSGSGTNDLVCHGCNGKGWVEVGLDDIERWQQSSNKCPSCGQDRNSPALTGCPKGSHYGTYCLA